MTIDEKLSKLIDILGDAEEKKKEKKFRLPFTKKVSSRQRRKNYVTIIKINENQSLDIKKLKIDEQTMMEEGIPRLAESKYVLYWKKNPVIILPSWSIKPISPTDLQENSLKDGSNTAGYKLILNRLEREATSFKKSIKNPLVWVLSVGLAVIIGYALMTGGGT